MIFSIQTSANHPSLMWPPWLKTTSHFCEPVHPLRSNQTFCNGHHISGTDAPHGVARGGDGQVSRSVGQSSAGEVSGPLSGLRTFVARAAYRAACRRWPNTKITLRQGTRVIEKSLASRNGISENEE
jgi:hypothetical protein